jgi:hypothetical protein
MNAAENSPENTCDRCGKEALGELGEETLCESCYHAETSCCGRFSTDEA